MLSFLLTLLYAHFVFGFMAGVFMLLTKAGRRTLIDRFDDGEGFTAGQRKFLYTITLLIATVYGSFLLVGMVRKNIQAAKDWKLSVWTVTESEITPEGIKHTRTIEKGLTGPKADELATAIKRGLKDHNPNDAFARKLVSTENIITIVRVRNGKI